MKTISIFIITLILFFMISNSTAQDKESGKDKKSTTA